MVDASRRIQNRAAVHMATQWDGNNKMDNPEFKTLVQTGQSLVNHPYFGSRSSIIFDVLKRWWALGLVYTPSQLLPVILRSFEAHFQVSEAQRLE